MTTTAQTGNGVRHAVGLPPAAPRPASLPAPLRPLPYQLGAVLACAVLLLLAVWLRGSAPVAAGRIDGPRPAPSAQPAPSPPAGYR